MIWIRLAANGCVHSRLLVPGDTDGVLHVRHMINRLVAGLQRWLQRATPPASSHVSDGGGTSMRKSKTAGVDLLLYFPPVII